MSKVDLTEFNRYSQSRREFLASLSVADSCRDPLSEFAEWLALQELGGQLADSRVQQGYDLVTESGDKVQVKYLANPAGAWRNGHVVDFSLDTDQYAIVFIEDLRVVAMLVFARDSLEQVCQRLKKRHPRQDQTLQLTQLNYQTILDDPDLFRDIGVRCFEYSITNRSCR